ncbi:MAG: tRNA pseudouridine(55) synthase TruB, partial [Eubacteriales bacterium]
MKGIINILKPPGMTSSDVVTYIRRRLNIKKVGHTGTLDPDAAGVLPICIGKATKISDYILQDKKIYICEVKLGIETDTLDISGEVTNRTSLIPSKDRIIETINSFIGENNQIPPMHSAIKIKGKKLY